LTANFRWKRTSPPNQCCVQKTRVIALSRGIKISAVSSFISSQSTRVTDGRTDRQTENYDPKYRASIAASHGNKITLQVELAHI